MCDINAKHIFHQNKNQEFFISSWGQKDFIYDKPILDEWIKYFPDSIVKTFDDCGHYVLEDAKEDVIKLIERLEEDDDVQVVFHNMK